MDGDAIRVYVPRARSGWIACDDMVVPFHPSRRIRARYYSDIDAKSYTHGLCDGMSPDRLYDAGVGRQHCMRHFWRRTLALSPSRTAYDDG